MLLTALAQRLARHAIAMVNASMVTSRAQGKQHMRQVETCLQLDGNHDPNGPNEKEVH